jgi:hypothetical protein
MLLEQKVQGCDTTTDAIKNRSRQHKNETLQPKPNGYKKRSKDNCQHIFAPKIYFLKFRSYEGV